MRSTDSWSWTYRLNDALSIGPEETVHPHDPSVADRVANRSPLLELDPAGNALARVTANDENPIGGFLDHLVYLGAPVPKGLRHCSMDSQYPLGPW